MARVPSNFKAQLITTDSNGNKYKRSFSKIRPDISDEDLTTIAKGINQALYSNERLSSMNLTANSALDL